MVAIAFTLYSRCMNRPESTIRDKAAQPARSQSVVGTICGVSAALCWALGFVVALHGVRVGFAPADLALHRFVWSGILFLPLLGKTGARDLGGVGWGRGLVLAGLSGPFAALLSYAGFTLVPLGHGAVIQPACATLGGLLLATIFLREPLSRERLWGALAIVSGLMLLGFEAMLTIGRHGLTGDLAFLTAGALWAVFGTLLRAWRLDSLRAMTAVSVVAVLVYSPIHATFFGYERIATLGLWENAVQVLAQGVLAGPLAIYLYARATAALGAGRAATFPSLVPASTLIIGFLALGQVPSLIQIAGLVVVLLGFRLVIKM